MTSDAFERQVQEYDAAMRRHDARAAAAAMGELVKISEPFVTFLKRAAWRDMRQQDYDAADAKFRTLATLTPGQPDITRALASAAIERGDIVRALIMLRDNAWVTSVRNPLNRGLEAHMAGGVAQGRFEARAASVGVAFIVGLGHTLVFAAANDGLSVAQAVSLATDVLVLALCGRGLTEPDARTVVARSVATVFGTSVA